MSNPFLIMYNYFYEPEKLENNSLLYNNKIYLGGPINFPDNVFTFISKLGKKDCRKIIDSNLLNEYWWVFRKCNLEIITIGTIESLAQNKCGGVDCFSNQLIKNIYDKRPSFIYKNSVYNTLFFIFNKLIIKEKYKNIFYNSILKYIDFYNLPKIKVILMNINLGRTSN
jgi:hypothetical protein